MNHDNIKPRQHCNYGGVHLNTAGSKILAENFILTLSRQTWLGIIRDNDALIGNVYEIEPSSGTTKYLPEDSLEVKVTKVLCWRKSGQNTLKTYFLDN